MDFLDANLIEAGTELHTDICIIGGGAAGITLANEFNHTDTQVLLLEGGGLELNPDAQELFDYESIGYPVALSELPRVRQFGGTTEAWYGRCAIMQPIDFEKRAWVPHSGWPIGLDEITPFYQRTAATLDIPHFEKIHVDQWRDDPAYQAWANGRLQPEMFLWANWIKMGPIYHDIFKASPNIQVMLNANVTELIPNAENNHIEAVELFGYPKNKLHVHAKLVILACGGMENPRLLLQSRRSSPSGIGNGDDVVGRYYMDHPRVFNMGKIVPNKAHPQWRPIFKRMSEKINTQFGRVQLYLAFDEGRQRQEELLNHCFHIDVVFSQQVMEEYLNAKTAYYDLREGRFTRNTVRNLGRTAAHLPKLLRAAQRRVRQSRSLDKLILDLDHLQMVDQLEQNPDPDSRITLSDQVDRFGKQRIRLDWRFSAATKRSLKRMHELVDEHLSKHKFGHLESLILQEPGYEPQFTDAAHPMGTTRMSLSPRSGVVDPNCKVHGVDNLYISGSSVFPTGGHANPTFTLMALAIRLADHLKQQERRTSIDVDVGEQTIS